MATEYGVFNAEGSLYGSMWSEAEAETAARQERAAGDPDAYAAPFCEQHRAAEQPATDCESCATELTDDGSSDEPRYQVHAFARGKYHVYDTETETDVATCGRKAQAQIVADGLNDGTLLVDERGLIVEAGNAEAGAR
ncbi:hypothetical protein [Nonomuraea rubra]|uniref:hypothetical protein n=1 Tax=Nonomuraea rubra TaxID=46180 RepID=UPI0033F924F6